METIRETILAYPGLEDCEVFLDKVVFPSRELTGKELSSAIDTETQKLIAADMYSMAGGNADFSENKLSISYPRSWYNAMARRLYREGGEPGKAELVGNKIEVPRGRSSGRW